LGRNAGKAELLLTTTSDSNAQTISNILAAADIKGATVSVVPNRGRDIGAMLTGFDRMVLERFDVLGHFHGKRSPQAQVIGDLWRTFLWEHLIGGAYAMMDVILKAFAADATLGLVFAEDPNLNGWGWNREFADELASRMGLRLPLPNHFDFPLGTMFWIRPQAIRPLLDLDLVWQDYPLEPVPIDGTPLHALERLVPFSAAHAGYRYATTYVRSSRR
jgi:lipopolysaccharide biosynthesis protein